MQVWRGFKSKVVPQKRFAFLLGNGAYTHIPRLNNPANDIAHVAEQLKYLDYKVRPVQDRDWRNTWFELNEFLREAKEAGDCDVMLFYYCGHGVQIKGNNYIVPIDFDPGVAINHNLEKDSYDGLICVQDVLMAMKNAKARFIFLDACRDSGGLEFVRVISPPVPAASQNEPFVGTTTRTLYRGPGLAKIKLSQTGEHNKQVFICFATDPGDVAQDGSDSPMSPFSEAVGSHIAVRGLEVSDFARRVARDVRKRTDGLQSPWANSNLTDDFAFHPADNLPVRVLGALGALTGLFGALFSFDLINFQTFEWGSLKLHDVRTYPQYLFLPLMLGSVLGYGAYRWGRRTWTAAVGTCLIYAACAALSRFWLAPYASDAKLIDGLKCLKPSTFIGSELSPDIRQMLLTALLAAAFAGAASVFSAAPFVRDMGKVPPVSTGAVIGASGAALFLLFLWGRAQVNEVLHDSCDLLMERGRWFFLEPLSIVALIMAWEMFLARNAGWTYAKPSNEES